MLKKSVFILIGLVLVMGFLAFFLERSDNKFEASKYIRLDVQAAQISELKIERKINDQTEIFDLKKTSEGWIFNNEAMQADTVYLNDLCERIQSAEFEAVALQPGQSLTEFRFSQPVLQIKITDNLRHPNILIMSERRNFEGQPYFKINQDEKIYTLESDLDKKFMNKKIFFQNKHIFKNQHLEFDKVEIQSLNQHFDILKIPGLDKPKLIAFISKIKDLTVQQYLPDSTKNKFLPPIMSVIMSGPGLKWALRLSLHLKDKRLYGEARIKGLENKTFFVEYDTSYWAYFSNLSSGQFIKDLK